MAYQTNTEPPDIEEMFMYGVHLYQHGESQEALDVFLHLLEWRLHVGALLFVGKIYQDNGELDLSIRYARHAVFLSPISALSSLVLHDSLMLSGKKDEAWIEVERFLNTPGAKLKHYLKEVVESGKAQRAFNLTTPTRFGTEPNSCAWTISKRLRDLTLWPTSSIIWKAPTVS